MKRASRFVGLSVDVDSVACHLQGYGFDRPPDEGAAYAVAVPRALDLFDRLGARATFFLVAGEAERWPGIVREIVERGHEVASHSLTHSVPFPPPGSLQEEVLRSKRILEGLSGAPVLGFRAPSWDESTDLRAELSAAGYRYDASAFPSILLPALRWAVARRSRTARAVDPVATLRAVCGRADPYFDRSGDREIVVIPLATSPIVRLPYYHTLRFLLPERVFSMIERGTLLRRVFPSYVMHAVDFLAVEEDRLDPRIGRHPGMGHTLEQKLEIADRAVRALGQTREVRPLADFVEAADRTRLRSRPAA